jgi:hypothetical protein
MMDAWTTMKRVSSSPPHVTSVRWTHNVRLRYLTLKLRALCWVGLAAARGAG